MKCLVYAIAFVTLLAGSAHAGDFAIITNEKSSQASISKKELKDLYMGEKMSWNGQVAKPCILSSAEGKPFFDQILNVSEREFNASWIKKELTGAGAAPVVRSNVDEVISYVGATTGAIGFVPKSAAGRVEGKKVKLIDLVE